MRNFLSRYWPVLFLLALTLIFFHRLVFSGLILGRGDTYAYFYPYWAARNAALMQGHLPLWSPDIFGGVPLLGNPQPGTFYPPNWLLVPLSPPDGIRLSVLLHVFWSLLGVYALARRWLSGAIPALSAAVIFGLGGYTGAHVEQINQLQGLAWMPWLFLLYDRAQARPLRYGLLLAMALALQFLTGHTQTVFISGVGLGGYGLVMTLVRGNRPMLARRLVQAVLILGIAGALALPLILPQLIPTMELTSVSNRSGGLNPSEATAFSLHPLIIGRGLLPSYDGVVFGEYVAYSGVIGLGLAIIGLLIPRHSRLSGARWVWGGLALVSLLLALGEFNPLYWQLAHLPGFNYFRVPARWLALFALASGMMAGIGLEYLLQSQSRLRRWHYIAVLGLVGGLAASSLLTVEVPEDVIGPAVPTILTWVGWGVAGIALLVLVWTRLYQRANATLLLLILCVELFFATGVMPYNTLVLPEAYHGQRFTISQLLAYGAAQSPPGRMLSISELLFDPGDRAALEARYAQHGFSDLAVRLSHVDTKLKEVVAPNLPLVWGIPSIDGFDGGLLPTRYYTAFTKLMLPPGSLATLDGRLRERMALRECRGACLPDQRWLNLTNTRYLITDKVFDLWDAEEGVAFDTTFTAALAAGEQRQLANPTAFEFTAVDVLYSGDPALPVVEIAGEDLSSGAGQLGDFWRVRWSSGGSPMNPESIDLQARAPVHIHAVTLIDTRTGDFAQLVPSPDWQRVLSSDIKLYENQAVLPRAFIVSEAINLPDSDEGTAMALQIMADDAFDPAATVTLHSDTALAAPPQADSSESGVSRASMVEYTPEYIVIQAESDSGGYLVLTDTYYPGWQATVDGVAAPIVRADIMFRAVAVPAGASEVIFRYQPVWLPGAQIAGIVAWLLVLLVAGIIWWRSASKY
ncbi:MAG: hypothetical protein CL610_27065 [Anaerolineaceae bacterium]|nr:hypothetical protein [Anaerolineaceae bacterium]